MDKKAQINTWYFVAALGFMLALQYWMAAQTIETVPYSEFQTLLRNGSVAEIIITETYIQGELETPLMDGRSRIRTVRVDPDFADDLAQYDVVFTGATEDTWLRQLISWVLPLLLFVGVWMFLIRGMAERQGMGGMMAVGQSKAKVYVEKDTKVTFEDVAGVDEAKQELKEIVDFLKNPKAYGRLGARMPKGTMLVGPPGTGKTLLARAVAGEAGVPFFSINGSEFVEMFVGVGAARVRDLFNQAAQSAPCIIFIDELDALGRARGVGPMSGGHDEKEQTLNQLLVELDGFDPRQGVVLIAATNRPEILDPALLRAGRFDRQVLVDRPDKEGRLAILAVHTKKISLGQSIDLEAIASITVGFTGADLANLANEAALVATRRGADDIVEEDFTVAFERIVAGLEKKNRVLNKRERDVVAHHEMGHALLALALQGGETVHKVSIIPRGIGALGYTLQRPTEERYLMDKAELEAKMSVLLGGRAAEVLVFDTISTGAGDDLVKATDIARSMIMQYGMDESLGQVVYEPKRMTYLDVPIEAGPRQFSEETAREIDCAVRQLVEDAYKKAVDFLTSNRKILEAGAHLLLDRETIGSEELRKITRGLIQTDHTADLRQQ